MVILRDIQYGFDQIASAVGKSKQHVIEWINNTNPDCMKALYYLLNPFKVYGIGEASLNRWIYKPVTKEWYSLFNMLDELSGMKGVNDQTIRNVQYFMEQNPDYTDLIRGMLTKSIKLGVTLKTVNKVCGYDFIPEFTVMLANKYFEHPNEIISKSFTITEKLDGIRCAALVHDGMVEIFSRQGQPIEGLVDIERSLIQIYNDIDQMDFVFDGELLITDRDKYPSKEQYKRTTKIVRAEGEKHGVTMNVFDVLDYDGFIDKVCHLPYSGRRQKLTAYISKPYDSVKAVPVLYSGSDPAVIMDYLNAERAKEHEGVMININSEPYQYKRTNALLKVKVMQDCDLRVTGVQEGAGKFAGTTGAIMVDYKGNTVGVGSGLSDEVRRKIWQNPDEYIGRVVTVQYFEQTNDKDGNLSIRFPVFKDFCEAGKEVSYN